MNLENVTIEKNILLQYATRYRRGKYDTLFRSMEVGDSFAVPLPNEAEGRKKDLANLRVVVGRATKVLGYKFSVRTQPGGDSVRTWRIA